ncbi:hypothetical protein AA958_15450 [Streptomyces sp. CNQ-509]|uniref:glycoside hydrolase domain-containing protein n=1 Tax=Streptomyces sp. CNQ-509 TaxID=444103 RepID=UPI00062DEED2|nr:glycoside hydrolase domain-containing protein [Streptomyces sp. CNQ-509]AKH83373.1 hypothetical protein AA958_15450 [Streptomyces sp. CNQ-509]
MPRTSRAPRRPAYGPPARWRTAPTLYGEPHVDPAAWRPHRRIHQYAGMVEERHGGKRIVIDRNVVDAPVAIMGPRT